MMLHRQIQFSLAIAAISEAILMQTSAEQAPSVHRVVARYLKLAFHANICPDVVHAGSHDLAVFCADFHFICPCVLSRNLLVRS